jgi:hypothetical protein
MAVMVVLAVAMAGVGIYRLRRTVVGPIVGFVLVAAVTVLAGLGYAFVPTITISGADCTKRTTSTFDPLEPTTLMSDCPNLIRILDIHVSCGAGDLLFNSQSNGVTVPDCSVGQTLANGGACRLPVCKK